MNMEKKTDFPLTMRILAALGMLEGRGMVPATLIILMAVMFFAILIHQGYVGWAAIIFGMVPPVIYVARRKCDFRTIKRKYGITLNVPYDVEHMTRLLSDFSENSDIALQRGDHTFVEIDGSVFPLIWGSVTYTQIQMESANNTTSAAFLLAQGSDFNDLRLKYQDVFEQGAQENEISIYWVRNLKRLAAILTPSKETKLIH
jgi:hypothetical protein